MTTAESFPATTQLESITRAELIRALALDTSLLFTGTATGGSTTTIIDTGALQSTQYDTKDWVGGWARISYDAGGAAAAPEAEIRPITTYANTTGTITVNPAFSAAPASGDKYELWRNPHPQRVLDIVDQYLTEYVTVPQWVPLSLVPDAWMEDSGTTEWAGTNATPTKSTTTPINGKQSLRVTDSGSGAGYSSSDDIHVVPGKQYMAFALGRCEDATTTAKFQIWDKTNGAEISSVSFISTATLRPGKVFTVPSTCYVVTLRLITVTASKYVDWDDAVVYPLSGRRISLPPWVQRRDQLAEVYHDRLDTVSTDLYSPDYIGDVVSDSWTYQDTGMGDGRIWLTSNTTSLDGKPLFIRGHRRESVFSNDNTDTKRLDLQLCVAATNYRIFQHLATGPNIGRIDSRWVEARFGYWKSEYERLMGAQRTKTQDVSRETQRYVNARQRYRFMPR